jgi:hypothetical protein
MSIIPFYGASQPELFEIERQAMDRRGLVTAALNEHLPTTGPSLMSEPVPGSRRNS